jgi:DNA-binding Lrp family transcriptional regulator
MAKMRLRQTDLAIVRILLADSLASVKVVSAKTGIPQSTVQKRIRHLKKQGSLRFQYFPSAMKQQAGVRALISIDVSSDISGDRLGYSNQEEFVRFLKLKLHDSPAYRNYTGDIVIENADILLGGYSDIVLVVSASSDLLLCDFVTQCLRALPGVHKTNTATMIAARDAKKPRK